MQENALKRQEKAEKEKQRRNALSPRERLIEDIIRLKANITVGKKGWAKNLTSYQKRMDEYLRKIGVNPDDENGKDKLSAVEFVKGLSDKQLKSMQESVDNMLLKSTKKHYIEANKQRAESIKNYLSKGGFEYEMRYLKSGETVFVEKNAVDEETGEIKDKYTRFSMEEISDFWDTFRTLYDEAEVKNLRNYDKGQAGVSTVFNIFRSAIKSIDDIKNMISNQYDEEKKSDMLQDAEDRMDAFGDMLKEGSPLLR
jgi:hypothetical protein